MRFVVVLVYSLLLQSLTNIKIKQDLSLLVGWSGSKKEKERERDQMRGRDAVRIIKILNTNCESSSFKLSIEREKKHTQKDQQILTD